MGPASMQWIVVLQNPMEIKACLNIIRETLRVPPISDHIVTDATGTPDLVYDCPVIGLWMIWDRPMAFMVAIKS